MALSCSKKTISIVKRNNIKNNSDFYCLNCLHSFRTKAKLESDTEFCKVKILSADTKILEFNQYQKSDEKPFIIYAKLECLREKIDECKSNPENSSTIKVGEHTLKHHHLKA